MTLVFAARDQSRYLVSCLELDTSQVYDGNFLIEGSQSSSCKDFSEICELEYTLEGVVASANHKATRFELRAEEKY